MTRHTTHIWRLLGWGITLARHGALVGIENDRNTLRPSGGWPKCALDFGTGKGRKPDYAGAFRAIGPAAIKLGQTLATRPDWSAGCGAQPADAAGQPAARAAGGYRRED